MSGKTAMDILKRLWKMSINVRRKTYGRKKTDNQRVQFGLSESTF